MDQSVERAVVDVAVEPVEIRGRRGAWITTASAVADERAYEAQFDALDDALGNLGMDPADAVRSRLTAATRPGRDAGSLVRLRRQALPFRTVTSSYIDRSRFAGSDGAIVETLALDGARVDKLAREHAPSPPPWRVVATGDLVFFSGITSFARALDDQLVEMASLIDRAMRLADALTGRTARSVAAATYVQRDLEADAVADLGARLGLDGVPLRVARCDGFSFPSKLVEVEIDAVLG